MKCLRNKATICKVPVTSQLGLADRVNTMSFSVAYALHVDALKEVLKPTRSLWVGLWLYLDLLTLISRPTVFTDEGKNKIKLFTLKYKLVSLIRKFQTGESDFFPHYSNLTLG